MLSVLTSSVIGAFLMHRSALQKAEQFTEVFGRHFYFPLLGRPASVRTTKSPIPLCLSQSNFVNSFS